jgi:hypothetical protein
VNGGLKAIQKYLMISGSAGSDPSGPDVTDVNISNTD